MYAWNQRKPIISKQSSGPTSFAVPIGNTHSLEIHIVPEYADYCVGDRIDVLAKVEGDWKMVAIDAVVTKKTQYVIQYTVKREHWMTINDACIKSQRLKIQRTISLYEPSVAVLAKSKPSSE